MDENEGRRWAARTAGLLAVLVTAVMIAGCDEEAPEAAAGNREVETGQGGSETGAAGTASAGGALAQPGKMEGGAATAGGAAAVLDEPTPYLLDASPADGSAGVYPFALPDGVSISLTFSEAMSSQTSELKLRAESGMEKGVPIEWADSGTEAFVKIAPNPLTGAPPLLDHMRYALDLSVLRSQHGLPLDPQRNLTGGALRFTTSAFDSLLNHACGHVLLGPFDSAVALDRPGALAVPTDTGHVNYTITLSLTSAGYEGYTRVNTSLGRRYHFLFDREIPAAIVRGSAPEEPLLIEPAAAACDGITHRAALDAAANEELFLHLGPLGTSSLHLILEIVSDG